MVFMPQRKILRPGEIIIAVETMKAPQKITARGMRLLLSVAAPPLSQIAYDFISEESAAILLGDKDDELDNWRATMQKMCGCQPRHISRGNG